MRKSAYARNLFLELARAGYTMEQLGEVLEVTLKRHVIVTDAGFTAAMLPPGFPLGPLPKVHFSMPTLNDDKKLSWRTMGEHDRLCKALLRFSLMWIVATAFNLQYRVHARLVSERCDDDIKVHRMVQVMSDHNVTMGQLAYVLAEVSGRPDLIAESLGFTPECVTRFYAPLPDNMDTLATANDASAAAFTASLGLSPDAVESLRALWASGGSVPVNREYSTKNAEFLSKLSQKTQAANGPAFAQLKLVLAAMEAQGLKLVDLGTYGAESGVCVESTDFRMVRGFGQRRWLIYNKNCGALDSVDPKRLTLEGLPALLAEFSK
jgi:hypothetical protein